MNGIQFLKSNYPTIYGFPNYLALIEYFVAPMNPTKLSILYLALLLQFSPHLWAGNQQNLPEFGDTTSGIVSLETERELGQEFLRSLRSQVPSVSDPLLKDYLEHLIYQLAEHSQLQDRRLDLIIIKSSELNAFAVPGGIVGINHGLFLNAENRHEFSAILAHELAHLSQRHFARQFETGKRASIKSLAGLLAGIVLIATTGGDAGLAAMSLGLSAAQHDTLKFSRARETEADRVGIYTLANAGLDPRAMAYMFERLNKLGRYQGDKVPDFLRTHPVTQKRVSDSYNHAHSYAKQSYPLNLDYQLMRVRVQVMDEESPRKSELRMRGRPNPLDPVQQTVNQYGLVLALTKGGKLDEAKLILSQLRRRHPDKIVFIIAEADILSKAEHDEAAIALLEAAISTSPDNYPLTMKYAEALLKSNQPAKAEKILLRQTQKREGDPDLWYQLAETYGLVNNIPGVHQARSQYFVLTGNLDQAIKQLEYALPLVKDNFQLNAKISQRIQDISRMREKRL